MDLTGTKAIVLVLLGLIKLFSGIAPIIFTRILEKKKNDKFLKKFIGVVLCFGGGILLSTVLLHMLREVRESLERATVLGMIPETLEYPLAELLVGMGFLLILLIESVVHKFFGGHQHGHSHFPSQETLAKKIATSESGLTEGRDNTAYVAETSGPRREAASQCNVYNVSGSGYKSYGSDSDSSNTETESKSSSQRKRNEKKTLISLRSFLAVLALSIHSLFEGMAIGLEETDAGVWKLLLAVSVHAIPIVFCVGTDMIASELKKVQIIIYMVVLSVNTPIGILIGILVTAHLENASGQHILVIGVLQGLAAGTLLYITFFEVLARDKLNKYGMSGLAGALAVMVGFTVMAGMEATGGHSHGGSGGHHGHAHYQHLSVSDGFHDGHDHSGLHLEHVHDHHDDHEHHGGHYHGEGDHDHDEHDHHGEEHEDHSHGDEDHDHDEHDHHGEEHEDHFHGDDDHDHDEHEHEHDNHGDDHHDHDGHGHHGDDHKDHDHEPDNHSHGDEDHDHDEHEHEHEDHDHEDEEPLLSLESEGLSLSGKSDEYFEYNITDPKFLHDSIAYD